MAITSDEALGYIYYYNNLPEHSALENQTPFERLREQAPGIHEAIRYVQPILLDTASVSLGPWSGYNVLTQNPDLQSPTPVERSAGRHRQTPDIGTVLAVTYMKDAWLAPHAASLQAVPI